MIAAEYVQPVPWVLTVSIRWPGNALERLAIVDQVGRVVGIPVTALDHDEAGTEAADNPRRLFLR